MAQSLSKTFLFVWALVAPRTLARADFAPSANTLGAIVYVTQASDELSGQKGQTLIGLASTADANSKCPGAKPYFVIKGNDSQHGALLSLATAALLSGKKVRLGFTLDAQDQFCYVYSLMLSNE